jgi:hypothetical protein
MRPMTCADFTKRSALIDGLRDLADYLESNPEVPTTHGATVYAFPPDGSCAEMRSEIDAIAVRLGSTAHPTAHGEHYAAIRAFGPVEYRAVAICKHHHDEQEGPR